MKKLWAQFVCFYPILLALLTGCSSVSKPMESWMGRHVNELTGDWGMPQQIMYEEDGDLIYVYHRSEETIRFVEKPESEENDQDAPPAESLLDYLFGKAEETPNPSPEDIPVEPRTYKKRSMLWINKEGVIYDWAWGVW
jgi:hypothetical protein